MPPQARNAQRKAISAEAELSIVSTAQPSSQSANSSHLELQLNEIDLEKQIVALRLAHEALQESEQRFRMMAEAMPQIVWITAADGKNLYFNQRWVDYTGLSLEESLGHGWNKPFHPDDRESAWNAWQHAIKTNGLYSSESRLRRADGVYHWWLIRAVSARDMNGKIVNWYGTCTDIEAQKEAEKVLLNERNRLELHANSTSAELHLRNEEMIEANTTLKVLARLRKVEEDANKEQFLLALKREVMPMLKLAIQGSRDVKQSQLLRALDASFQQLIASYTKGSGISEFHKLLTPKQVQVALMVRDGMSSKAIASTMCISSETVSIHRKNIRKLLGIESKSSNLRSYLVTLGK